MNSSILVDTNILLDAAMAERPDHAWALMLFDEAVYGNLQIFVAGTSYKEVYCILEKYSSEAEARSYVRNLLRLTTPVAVSASCLEIAIDSNEPDFANGISRACAESSNVDIIVSRDEKAFSLSVLKRMTAREYLEAFCDVHEIELRS